jgi:cobyrinic acid a,c-diamide synthase
MYLCRSIRWGDETHEMVGFIPADAVMHKRPQGRGLVLLEETPNYPWPPSVGAIQRIAAHEFHYAALENLEKGLQFAWRMERGAGIENGQDGIIFYNVMASFCHLRATAANPWVERYVEFIRANRITIDCSGSDITEYDE